MMSATKLSHRALAACGARNLLLRSGRTVRAGSVLVHPGAGAAAASGSSAAPSVAWSHELSYASPESDFTSQQARASNSDASPAVEWSQTLSFASPECDFASQGSVSEENYSSSPQNRYAFPLWSGLLSFASPESDFVAQGLTSGGAPSSTAGVLPRTLREVLALDEQLGHATADTDLNQRQMNPPAIVVTTAAAPHRIVHVNRAWEELCGYGRDEVVKDNKTLSILQGPKSNADLARSTVSKLVRTHRAVDMYQVNYAKSGREFLNHVTMGPLTLNEDSPDVEFLVAVLEQVEPEQVPLRMVSY
jgi:PAS domain S-box-containing protein